MLSVCHTMNKYGRKKVYLHAFLTLAVDESVWSASCPGYFSPENRNRKFDQPQIWSIQCEDEKNLLTLPRIDHLALSVVVTLSAL
jgi:hypothetical protein